jgi:NRAMP (natural resistance-associated macrophage protein)-like metal ion transporter
LTASENIGGDEPRSRLSFLRSLGPGLVAGASDDDPSGIASYAQAGALLGYTACWFMLLCYPMMVTTQEISARIGRATGRGLIGMIARHSPRWLLDTIVLLVVGSNIINLGADLGAMGAVLHMITGGPTHLFVVLLGIACAALLFGLSYERYVAFVKWMTLSMFAYFATAFNVDLPWGQIAYHTVVPELPLNAPSVSMFVAVLGTTISPYLFIWQSSLEAERARGLPKLRRFSPLIRLAGDEINRIRIDTFVGMAVAALIAYAVIITSAATLHQQGMVEVRTAAEAAEALRPATGALAEYLFALGILGTGLLAVPMLAGSAAYAVAEARKFPTGLGRLPHQAPVFYGAILAATLAGVAMNFTRINPMQALLGSAVINGLVSVPLLVLMMLVAREPAIMGRLALPRRLLVLGWLSTAIMLVTAIGLVASPWL